MKGALWLGVALSVLAALATPAQAQMLTGLSLVGPNQINEGTSALYNVRATFSNGLTFDVTLFSQFSLTPAGFASISQFGELHAGQVDLDLTVTLSAAFTWGTQTLVASQSVVIIDTSGAACQFPAYQWTRTVGGAGNELARGVHIDAVGDVYVVGSFEGTVDFDPTSGTDLRTAQGGADAFLTKYTPNGGYAWTRVFAGSGSSVAASVDLAPDGSIYIAGNFDGSIDLNPGAGVDQHTAVGGQDFFVVKLSAAGDFVWGRTIGGNGSDEAYRIAVDVNGDCVVVGGFMYVVDFDPTSGADIRTGRGSSRDIFALKLTSAGGYGWVYTAGGQQLDEALGVAVDAARNVFVVGRFSTLIDFDPGPGQVVGQVVGVTDAFVVRLSPNGVFQWLRTFGGPSTDGARDVAIAPDGDLIIGGYFWETVDFDPTSGVDYITSAGYSDGFIMRLGPDGSYRWTTRIGGPQNEEVLGVAIDSDSRVLACGYFGGTVDFDDGPGAYNITSAGAEDAFVAKFGATTGALQWAATGGGSQSDIAYAIASDQNSHIVCTGTFRGTADFDPSAGSDPHTSAGGNDVFTVELQCGHPAGAPTPFVCDAPSFLGATTFGGVGTDRVVSIAHDRYRACYVAGVFSGTVDFDPGPGVDWHTASGNTDVFLAKFDVSGAFQWCRTFGGPGVDAVEQIAVDPAGTRVAVAGTFSQAADFDPGAPLYPLMSAGGLDAFVSVFTTQGDFVWARAVGGSWDDYAHCVAFDYGGNVLVGGGFQGTADFDPGIGVVNRTSRGGLDAFVWKLSASGNLVWAYTVGKTSIDEVYGIAVTNENDYVITGWFQTIVDFDPGPGMLTLTAVGATDVFVAKLAPDGTPRWAKSVGGPSTEVGRAVAVEPNGDIAIAGSFWDTVDFDPGTAVVNRTAVGQGDVFVLMLTSSGDFRWVRTAGSPLNDEAWSVALDGGQNVLAAGIFNGECNFDLAGPGYSLESLGATDGFTWKLSHDGAFRWAIALGGGSEDDASAVDVDASALIRIGGSFSGNAYLDPDSTVLAQSAGGADGYVTTLQCGVGVAPPCPGDLNCDGQVDFAEVDLFAFALQGQAVWDAAFPGCPWLNADCNGDGTVDFADIDPFVALIGTVCPQKVDVPAVIVQPGALSNPDPQDPPAPPAGEDEAL